MLPRAPPPSTPDLAKLEDSSCADVFARMQLHRRVLPLLVQLQDGDPQLDPAGHLVPPADRQQDQVSGEVSRVVSQFTVCMLGSLQFELADVETLHIVCANSLNNEV